MDNPIYNRIKSEHPDWSEEQIWTAVSLYMQSDVVIEQTVLILILTILTL